MSRPLFRQAVYVLAATVALAAAGCGGTPAAPRIGSPNEGSAPIANAEPAAIPAVVERPGDREAALQVLERGMSAQGGERALARTHLRIRAAAGEMFQGQLIKFSSTITMDLPARFRDVIDAQANGIPSQFIQVINPKSAWRSIKGEVSEFNPQEAKELREEAYLYWVASLAPLKEKPFVVVPIPEEKGDDGEKQAGIAVSSPDHQVVQLFFDKKTGLLARARHATTNASLPVTRDYHFSDYREFSGVKMPTREDDFMDKSKELYLVISSWEFPNSVSGGLFDRP